MIRRAEPPTISWRNPIANINFTLFDLRGVSKNRIANPSSLLAIQFSSGGGTCQAVKAQDTFIVDFGRENSTLDSVFCEEATYSEKLSDLSY